ncbi:MAG: tyrosine-type recombinase/integrase [Thermoguttaceae bacterium]|jgi:integrase
MGRPAKPWYWKARKIWCVCHKGERILLGPDRAEALRQYHQIMAKPEEKRQPVQWGAVAAILDDFLTWTEENRAAKTYTRYRDFIQSFVSKYGRMEAGDLNPSHVTTWLNSHKGWNSTTKRNAITALQRGFNWAVKNRGLLRNPIRGMEKPEAKRRTAVITSAEFDELLKHVHDVPFHDLLIVSYDSGSRPQETKQLEARHLQLDKQRAVIPGEEAKRGRTRAIYFPTDRSLEIVTRLAKKHPTGPLFRNNEGRAWTGFAVKLRFDRIQVSIGRQEMAKRGVASAVTEAEIDALARDWSKARQNRTTDKKTPTKLSELRSLARKKLVAKEAKQYAKRFRQYDLRHSFVTRKLRAGVDSHVVAALVGHKDTKMIDAVYSHVADDPQFMLEAAKKEVAARDRAP